MWPQSQGLKELKRDRDTELFFLLGILLLSLCFLQTEVFEILGHLKSRG